MRLSALHSLRFTCLCVILAVVVPFGRAQEVESGYGPLPVFEFHSGFWVNLHHFLYHEARARVAKNSREVGSKPSGPVLKPTPGTSPSLSPVEQKAWDRAMAYYTAEFAQKDLVVNLDLVLLKNQLGDFEDCDELTGKKRRSCDAGLPGDVGPILEAAAPVYRSHWWPDQDRANRRWVTRVAPLVREQGVGLSQKLADIYQTSWPKDKIRVEVTAFANAAGAYTTLDPLRVTISSTDTRNQGTEALEVLFHEASHDIARPVEIAITRECKQRDKPIPRDLWHALIFFTTGEVLYPILHGIPAEEAGSDSGSSDKSKPIRVPPEIWEKLKQRGWGEYNRLVEIYWQPYLDGRVRFEDAIAHLVSAA